MSTELYKKYRPRTLGEVVGQKSAVETIKKLKAIPHAMLFHGPSGTGKTTIARIIANEVLEVSKFDLQEVNCGVVESAIDMVRQIQQQMTGAAMGGKARAWILDEVQSFSRAKFAQEAMLKILEDGPDHVYFFLCTTDPKKVLTTIRNRCTEVGLKPIPVKDLEGLVTSVATAEKLKLSPEVLDRIVEAAGGSGRKALVELERVAGLPTEEDRLAAVGYQGSEKAAFDLVKALLPWRGKPDWAAVAGVLRAIKEEDPEGLRQMVLASARSMLLTDKPIKQEDMHRAYRVISCLRDPLWDRNSGHAILTAGCYEVVFGKS